MAWYLVKHRNNFTFTSPPCWKTKRVSLPRLWLLPTTLLFDILFDTPCQQLIEHCKTTELTPQSREANGHSGIQKFPAFLWNLLISTFTRACNTKPHATFRNKLVFYDDELLAPHSIPKLENHPLLAVFSLSRIQLYRGQERIPSWIHKMWRKMNKITINYPTFIM